MWYPSTWEGWLVLFFWLVLFVFTVSKLADEGLKYIWVVFLFTGILIYVCYNKGEKPRWQWGKRVEDIIN